jgi:hypothetical protein
MAFAQTRTFEQSFDLANFNVLRNLRFLRLKGSDSLASVGFMPAGPRLLSYIHTPAPLYHSSARWAEE